MFWRKKANSTPAPPEPPVAKPPPLPGQPSTAAKQELRKELEAVGHSDEKDVLTAGIGMIKAGSNELLPGWLREFGRSHVFVVSVEESNPQTAFVFGPKGDRNYVAVFTRLDLAQECLKEFPSLRFAMKLTGIDLLELARDARRGVWINPLNEACGVRFPADMIGRFIQEARRGRA